MDPGTPPVGANRLEFRLLGAFEVLSCGRPIVLGSRAMRRLMALLTLNANQVVSVDRIIKVLWDGEPPATVRTILQGYVSRLRKLIVGAAGDVGDVAIITRSPGYLLRIDPGRIDLHRARELAKKAALLTGRSRAVALRAALELWRGHTLADMDDLPALRAIAMSIEELRLSLVEDRIAAELAEGPRTGLVTELDELVAAHPLRERLTDQLMMALHHTGRRADALRRYHALRERLAEELGVDPSPQLQLTYQRILQDEATVVAPETAEPASTDSNEPAVVQPVAGHTQVVPAQLPPRIGGFVGRDEEFIVLDSLRPSRRDEGGSTIAVVSGEAGLGKSALAVNWAHRVSNGPDSEYPDGQLFASLRAVDPCDPPVSPADVLRQFLIGLGLTSEQIPTGLTERTALYRSITAKRRMLVLLDDAVDHLQVSPLLPASPSCTVVITSRRMLDGLLITNGARLIRLGPLSAAQAGELIKRLAVGVEPTASDLDRLTELCGNLPLALRIAAARMTGDPELSIGDLIDELADERRRLGALRAGDPQISVRGALELTYRRLRSDAARLFRLIGVHPGVELSRSVLAAMSGSAFAQVAEQLHVLESVHLISSREHGRFGSHDLVRLYARELATDELDDAERLAAETAMVDFYLAVAERGRDLIRSTPGSPGPYAPGFELPETTSLDQAVGWFDREWNNLMHAARTAVRRQRHEAAWRIAWGAAPYVLFRHLLDESTELFDQGLASARTSGDRFGECLMLRCRVNVALYRSAKSEEALEHAVEALAIAEELGKLEILAPAVSSVFTSQANLGRYEDARQGGERALSLYQQLGDLPGQAMALNNLAMIDQFCGRVERAYERCLEVLALYRRFHDPGHEAVVLNNLSELAAELGDWSAAENFARQARSVAVSCGASVQEAKALVHLGDVYHHLGDQFSAKFRWEQALILLQGSSSPVRAEIDERLARLTTDSTLPVLDGEAAAAAIPSPQTEQASKASRDPV
ncbi:AfsR/SARP family transcriptional regulator [Actinoalloteichus hymeniacidonis]|uniref:DNA-binding transcriptional activator of the SARP family n=1 Tax=Actinoalloteichus hymeniacidonis TaxID=340345 RepID=A0AAC9HL86_9PSEU|nr:BTAD domain-containing putative transcriptional regulator [Actinoalloteichus hymeniacidonis]AOS61241.1 DNA-binding transcriptional activator of the SARP family [Actinoalloteichus hymeniacidonis]MBB5910756.1 DNA-binding SARP family transcriptional activator/tetratricopeptide (TPR) repeat protein [Actinoalloteichus hymeniacidonis]